jgi:hypothetical protein
MPRRPKRSTVFATAPFTASASALSAWIASVVPPAFSISATIAFARPSDAA